MSVGEATFRHRNAHSVLQTTDISVCTAPRNFSVCSCRFYVTETRSCFVTANQESAAGTRRQVGTTRTTYRPCSFQGAASPSARVDNATSIFGALRITRTLKRQNNLATDTELSWMCLGQTRRPPSTRRDPLQSRGIDFLRRFPARFVRCP
jgi:hypothetical protein